MRIIKVCLVCAAKFTVKPCRKETAKYCSVSCRASGFKGHRPYHWKGGVFRHKGYVYQLAKGHPAGDRDGYVYQHRLVMEKHLGRYLNVKEVVNHKNGIRDDNRIENLEVFASQSDHMKTHFPKGMQFSDGPRFKEAA